MYRRPKFLEVLLEIRQEMARLADYDVDLFTEMARTGKSGGNGATYMIVDSDPEPDAPKERKGITRDERKTVRKN